MSPTESPSSSSPPSRSQRKSRDLLEELTVPLRLACHTKAGTGTLWMLSLWFRYRDGKIQCATAADADVVAFLESDPHVAFEVSTNDPPYRGVRGNGMATITPDPEKAVLTDLLERYLGTTSSPLARSLLRPERAEVTISIEPLRLSEWDFSERMRETTREE